MAKFAVDDKVYIPATITSLTESNDGVFYELKLRAINSTKILSVEESDIVARETNTNTNTTPTDTEQPSSEETPTTTNP